MSEFERRDFLAGAAALAAAATATLVATNQAEAGDPSFMNNVPDPLLAGKELPTFKFALEKSEGKVIGGSYGKEATVKQLPISKGIAGVSMKLEPGAMRELHWHATAAEWAFVIEGRVRTTVIDPRETAETNDFEPGDLWYFPRGHGHMLECLGNEPCHFILIFDNGYFSEFGTFSISDWIGHTAQAAAGQEFWPAGVVLRRVSEGGSLFRPRKSSRRKSRRKPLQGWKLPPQTHKYRMLAQPPHGVYKGGREWRVDSTRFRNLQDHHRRDSGSRSGWTARTALASDCRRVAIRHRGEHQRDDVRLARPLSHRNPGERATSATSRRDTAIRSKMSATSRAAF